LMEMHLEKVLSKKTEEKKHFSWYLESHWREEQDPDPEVSGTNPGIRIRIKMSRIHNNGHYLRAECTKYLVFNVSILSPNVLTNNTPPTG
jgi:hypothetical protein